MAQSHKQQLTNNDVNFLKSQFNQTPNGLAFNYIQSPVQHVAQIGISLEPIESVNQMVPAIDTSASSLATFAEFVNKTVGNMYNFSASFSRPLSELVNDPSNYPSKQYVPLASVQSWYENYTNRLKNDPNFWKKLN